MRKQGEGPPRVNSNRRTSFRVVPVKRAEHLFFNLCHFDFFRKSNGGHYLFFGNFRLLAPIVAVPYVLSCEIIFFRKKRFFVKLRERVAGIFIVREKGESLYINSLAVAPEYRRSGLGRFILDFAAKLGKRLGKKWLELSVLKTNGPARRLYAKADFSMFEERKHSLTLRKRLVWRSAYESVKQFSWRSDSRRFSPNTLFSPQSILCEHVYKAHVPLRCLGDHFNIVVERP